MYHYLFGLSLLKSITPYFRKHVLTHLDPHDFFLVNVFSITFIVMCILLYRYFFDKTFDKKFKKITSMKLSHIGCILVLAVLTVVSSITIMSLDKNHNTPLLNSIFLRVISTITFVLVSIFVFKENYTLLQFFGISLIILGSFLVSKDK